MITFLLAVLAGKFIVKAIWLKVFAAVLLNVLVVLQMSIVEKNNLSLVYKGAGITSLTYSGVFFIMVFVYKLIDPDQDKNIAYR